MRSYRFIKFSLFIIFAGLLAFKLFFGASDAQSDQVPLIPRALLFGNPVKASPELSPDGSKLAYLAPDDNNVLNVWVRDLINPAADWQVTSDTKRGIYSFSWQYDNEHLLYPQDKEGDENWHLFQTDINSKETRSLTPYDGVRVAILDYDFRRPDQLLLEMNQRDPGLFDVYQLNLKTGKIDLNTTNTDNVVNWVADQEGVVRISQAYAKNGDMIIRVRDSADSSWRVLLTIHPEELESSVVAFTPDNQSIYLVTSVDAETLRLIKMNLKTGEQVVIAENPTYDVSGVLFQPTRHTLEAVAFNKEKVEWELIDKALTDDFQFLKKASNGNFKIVSRDLEDRIWTVSFYSDIKPSQYYLYDRSNKQLTFLFSTRPELEEYRLSPMQPISFKARDGMELHGYLSLPLDKEAKNLPTVILVHGGPWVRDSWGLNPPVQWLTNRGYAVLQINYRGSTGYGKEYLNAGNRQWGKNMQTDLLDGKEWMVSKGYANADKVAIFGGSYGGYAVLAALAFYPEEFCCGVDIVGPSNLITLIQTIPPYWGPSKVVFEKRVGSLERDEEYLKAVSPLFKAGQITKPLLIAQGANDPRVKQAESDQIVEAMRANNKTVEYLLFADEGHGFARPENNMKFYAAAESFLSTYLGGRRESPSEEESWEDVRH